MSDVSGHEPDCDRVVCTSGKPGGFCMAAEADTELSDGTLLADFLCRTVCEKSVCMDQKMDGKVIIA